MRVAAFDLRAQQQTLREDLLTAIDAVLSEGQFILGGRVELLEQRLAEFCGAGWGIGVANGSDGLALSLLGLGIGPGDEVIVPAFTFFATAGAVARVGATPVFVDVDLDTYNIDVDGLERRLTKRTRAMIPVHLFGRPAAMEQVMSVAAGRDLFVVEDAAQAIGAAIGGRRVGSWGDAAVLSFFPTKNLGGCGDGGMVLTRSASLAEQLRMLRVHGSRRKYYHEILGFNSRLDELQAAILLVKLDRLDEWTSQRRRLAHRYDALFAEAGLADRLGLRPVEPGLQHVYHQYTIRLRERDALQGFLKANGIGTSVYYPLPLHLQPVFRSLGYEKGALPNSERLCQEVLSLPMYPELTVDEQDDVVECVRRFFRSSS